MKKIVIVFVVVMFMLVACKSSKNAASDNNKKSANCNAGLSLEKDIKPILTLNCNTLYGDGGYGCHNGGKSPGFSFGQQFESSIKKAATNGKLLGSIKHIKGFSKMPQGGNKLDQEIIDKIECWINNGMKE